MGFYSYLGLSPYWLSVSLFIQHRMNNQIVPMIGTNEIKNHLPDLSISCNLLIQTAIDGIIVANRYMELINGKSKYPSNTVNIPTIIQCINEKTDYKASKELCHYSR